MISAQSGGLFPLVKSFPFQCSARASKSSPWDSLGSLLLLGLIPNLVLGMGFVKGWEIPHAEDTCCKRWIIVLQPKMM